MNRSPTSQTCHEHIWSPTSVTNIERHQPESDFLDECEIKGFQYHPIFHNQYGFDLEKDVDGEDYTYVGPCGNNARCINHEIGYTCECLVKV